MSTYSRSSDGTRKRVANALPPSKSAAYRGTYSYRESAGSPGSHPLKISTNFARRYGFFTYCGEPSISTNRLTKSSRQCESSASMALLEGPRRAKRCTYSRNSARSSTTCSGIAAKETGGGAGSSEPECSADAPSPPPPPLPEEGPPDPMRVAFLPGSPLAFPLPSATHLSQAATSL